MTFDEACRRAAGRRAYNRQRRLERARRISAILVVQDRQGDVKGRTLAAALGVHEATISRDLKFIKRIKDRYRRSNPFGCEMRACSFKWIADGRGWETTFLIRDGARLK
jgi:hypothetical protein